LVPVIRVACQVLPPSKDTCTAARVILAAAASCRCRTVIAMDWRPAAADPARPSAATR
jgi:hypothetical protein